MYAGAVLPLALDRKFDSALKLNLRMPDLGQPLKTPGKGAPAMLQNLFKAVLLSLGD